MTKHNATYGVEASYLSENRRWGTPDDYSVWYDTIEEAIKAAREDAQKSGETIEIRKYSDDETIWDSPITVDPNGGVWSNDSNARAEIE